MLRALGLASVLVLGLAAQADSLPADSPWEVHTVELTKVAEGVSYLPLDNRDCGELNYWPRPASVWDQIGWDQIINIGQKIWDIIQKGKPVVHVEAPVAYALPRGLTCWLDLDHWQAPRTQVFEAKYKNGFGSEVVKFRFRLHYTYGGGRSGRGQYLTNVTVMPAELNVSWGYSFDSKVDVQPAVNIGSAENPVAGLEMNVGWTVSTMLKESVNSFHFFVQGDGEVKTAQ